MFLWLLLSATNFIFLFSEGLSNNLKYTVLEEVRIGTQLGQVIQNAQLEREVSAVSNCQLFDMSFNKQSVDLVRVNSSTCELFVNSRIDREQLCEGIKCVLQLSVFIDAKIWVSVALEIIDINDNSPKFDSPFIIARFEENSIIGHFMDIPLATDADIGQNSVQTYSLKPLLDLFELEHSAKNTLRLVLRGKLDYEDRSERQFSTEVLACDHGSPSLCGKLVLKIQVLDINDNRPIFTKCNDSVNVMEDSTINHVVYQVTSYDLDDGENGRISYDISSIPENKIALQYFSINQTTGKLILSKSLHSKGIPEKISVTISARDHGTISLMSECKVILNIIDVNNHSPSIAFKPTLGQYFQITENIAEVTTVALVMVTDGDKNNNGKVNCELRNTSFPVILERWSIHSSTYKLSITKPMDREVVRFVNVSVICSDYGIPPRRSEKNLSITVIDVNEFTPKLIINPMNINIAEDLPINTSIAKLHTSDQDADSNLTVKLLLDNDNSFAINSNDNLILRKALDRELRPLYHLIVIVIDNGPPVYRTTTVTLTITILDVNDHPPMLQEPRSFHLLENLVGSSSKIGQLKSYDPDLGINGSVKYKLLNAISLDGKVINNSFSITENDGIIFSHLPMDREMTPEIILKVLLKDQGTPVLSKEEKVHITIADENDNKPIWQFPSPENCNLNLSVVSPGRYNERHILITIVRVTDPDSPENANITFNLLSASKNKLPVHMFTLEPISGNLMGIGAISEGIYVLKMQASDNGRQPLLSEVATLFLTAYLPNTGFFFNNETDRLSLTLIVALASVTCIICISLLVAIIVVRRHRYSSIQLSSNGHANDHNSLVNDSLTKWTEEQNQYLDSWNYPPHYYSFPIIPGLQKLSSIGEPLLPPPGPKDVLSNVNNQQHICPVMHLRRPTNQDLDVSSADSGRGASEEETMLTEAKNRESVRTRSKMYTTMPPISSVCACQDSMSMCGSCANNLNGAFHYQYVTYSPTSYQTLDDTRSNIQFHTSRSSHEPTTKTYHTLDTMVTATSMGSQTGFAPMESIIQHKSPKDMSSFLGPHSNV